MKNTPNPKPISRRNFVQTGATILGGSLLLRPSLGFAAVPAPVTAASSILEDSLDVCVHASGPANIRVRAWPDNNPGAITYSNWIPTNAANAARIRMPSCGGPGASWSWQSEIAPPASTSGILDPVVRSMPARPAKGVPSKFTFSFSSCLNNNGPIPTARVAKAKNPAFYAMLGDWSYWDTKHDVPSTQTYDGYAADYRKSLTHPDLSDFLTTTPIMAMQDDHDYGILATGPAYPDYPDNSVLPCTLPAYADTMPGTLWPANSYRKWSIGEVDFFLTDNRRYDGTGAGIMGAEQKNWLLTELASSTARVKVIFIPKSFSWNWNTKAQNEILNAVRATDTVLLCSGDRHTAALCKPRTNVWDMLAGPMAKPDYHDLSSKPRPPGFVWGNFEQPTAAKDCVGVIEVDTLETNTLKLHFMTEDGSDLYTAIMPLTNSTPIDAAPSVSITSPATGATLSGIVPLTATANDDVAVLGVQFELDGANLGTEIASSPYQLNWDTRTIADGSHSLVAVARDAMHFTESAAVTVTVSNGIADAPPAVPTGLAPVEGVGSVSLSWNPNLESDLASYQLRYRPKGSTAPYTMASLPKTATSYLATGLTSGIIYEFMIRARDKGGQSSPYSPKVSATPH